MSEQVPGFVCGVLVAFAGLSALGGHWFACLLFVIGLLVYLAAENFGDRALRG